LALSTLRFGKSFFPFFSLSLSLILSNPHQIPPRKLPSFSFTFMFMLMLLIPSATCSRSLAIGLRFLCLFQFSIKKFSLSDFAPKKLSTSKSVSRCSYWQQSAELILLHFLARGSKIAHFLIFYYLEGISSEAERWKQFGFISFTLHPMEEEMK
jgi:hypothetical protein